MPRRYKQGADGQPHPAFYGKLGNALGTFRHKQDSTLVAEQTAISSIYRLLRVNI